jgi:hypothetical protein
MFDVGFVVQESVKIALIAIYRDLRGITAATHNKRTYNLLFDVGGT